MPDLMNWLTRHRRLGLFALGGLMCLALPPFSWWPVALLILPVFAWQWATADSWQAAFGRSWWFYCGFLVFGLYWIAFALTVDLAKFFWLVPFAVLALPMALALFPALLATGLLPLLQRVSPVWRLLAFPFFWVGHEWLRGHLFTGFPWNLLGYVWSEDDTYRLLASDIGIYGLSFVIAAVAVGLTFGWIKASVKLAKVILSLTFIALLGGLGYAFWTWIMLEGSQFIVIYFNNLLPGFLFFIVFLIAIFLPAKKWHRPMVVLTMLMPLIWLWWIAMPKMGENSAGMPRRDNRITVRLVQPNIAQAVKWQRDMGPEIWQSLLQMTAAPATDPEAAPALVIWPEAAAPAILNEQPVMRRQIGMALRASGAQYLLAGGIRRDDTRQLFNSMLVIDQEGEIVRYYDKHHLVPFGEFLPFRDILPIPLVANVFGQDLSRGPGSQTLELKLAAGQIITFSPLICYEAIFPGEVMDPKNPPDLLVNITDDSWYGPTSGPYQHFNIARMRAVEEGIPMVRVANTGISAAFDAQGRTLGKALAFGVTGFQDVRVPIK